MKKYILIFLLFTCKMLFSQEASIIDKKDTLVTHLDEINIVVRRTLNHYRQSKIVSSLDALLDKSDRISMIRRGNYAWEPSLNNMTSDRLNITIDGMQLFGACTDKMDPITSYVDVSNLQKVTINSGQEGTENAHSIGGGIDLKLPDSNYFDTGLKSSFDLGYETNGNYRTLGLDLEYSGDKFYMAVDGIYRHSDNYKSGGNNEVNYSQFKKYNISLQSGYKISNSKSIDANIIYDRANDIGYPALPMDVSLAEATIASLSYNYSNESSKISNWETKLYINSITHVMDDSKRPDVPIRMDMPGWSDTYGFYSKIDFAKIKKHQFSANVSAHYNKSLAEMTMYPNDPEQNSMFMYTWPDIRTLYSGIYVKDIIQVSPSSQINLSTRLGVQNNTIAKEVGLQSLQIFYPNISDSKHRFLTSLMSKYIINYDAYDLSFGIGYGERAPSVSEGYGFYLFNSFDNYDYIGNPTLKNEASFDINLGSSFKTKNFKISAETSFFYIRNYIIGRTDQSLSPMTIGANGVRIYRAMDYANIFKAFINTDYNLTESISINASIGYNYGNDSDHNKLPLISPLSYFAEVNYRTTNFNAALQLDGNATQNNYSSFYGEDKTPSYAILNINLGNNMYINNNRLLLKYGIENLLDTSYSSYADWNNIPRQGRNFYLNVSYIFD